VSNLFVLIIVGVFILLWALSKIDSYAAQKRKDKVISFEKLQNEVDFEKKNIELEKQQNIKDREAIDLLTKQKSIGFPWLADAYATYFQLQDLKKADYLDNKPHPAKKSAEIVREVSSERRKAEKICRILKYQLEYYEKLFPWLIDFKSEDIDDLLIQLLEKKTEVENPLEEEDDPVRNWLTEAEYRNLSGIEKNQIALDRYWKKKKTRWEIGRDYERFIGYRYEKSGHSVYYQGIVEGFADLGRDLIAIQGNKVEIIQCKCWSQEKTIHEKHIFQLFGTTIEYYLSKIISREKINPSLLPDLLNREQIKATLFTSTKVSEKAKDFANLLRVQVVDNFPLQKYPSIKCNISRRSNEKIYHLPFDQQYDRTVIEEERNECYAESVKEAEDLGFRRAWGWRGQTSEDS
jgi:hypothetical protein